MQTSFTLAQIQNIPPDGFAKDEGLELTITFDPTLRGEGCSYNLWTFAQAEDSDPDPIFETSDPYEMYQFIKTKY